MLGKDGRQTQILYDVVAYLQLVFLSFHVKYLQTFFTKVIKEERDSSATFSCKFLNSYFNKSVGIFSIFEKKLYHTFCSCKTSTIDRRNARWVVSAVVGVANTRYGMK